VNKPWLQWNAQLEIKSEKEQSQQRKISKVNSTDYVTNAVTDAERCRWCDRLASI